MMGKGLGRLYLEGRRGGGALQKKEVEQRRKLSKPQSKFKVDAPNSPKHDTSEIDLLNYLSEDSKHNLN